MTTPAEVIHGTSALLKNVLQRDLRLEIEVLLAHVLQVTRSQLLARLQDPIDELPLREFDELLARLIQHEPLAYIIGYREFYGIEITCWDDALIPRPETEMLVDLALEEITRRGDDLRIIDVGTGAGAVAIAIAENAPQVRIIATDASAAALDVATKNVRAYGVGSRVMLRPGDLLASTGEFDLILANLPYVSEGEWQTLEPEIQEYEPRSALVGGVHGTEIIERLIAEAPQHLAEGGVLAAEIGETQGERLLTVARRFFPDGYAYVMKDYAGKDRVLVIRREEEGIG
ncbi:MAG: peptide chain release factor N(5)-glutamine methyltransferase [Dehalococcoidia bacterium]